MNREWFFGFVSGVLATVIGFTLTIAWDVWKERRQTVDRDQAITRAISSDLDANKVSIEANLRILAEELNVLPEKKSVVQPLGLMKSGFWEVAKINPPEELLTSGQLAKLSELLSRAEAVNDQIRSRETYRLHNEAMSNFHNRLRIYDEVLIQEMSRLRDLIQAYQSRAAQHR